jgi:putative SOS response-associated peptidase YedK
MCYAYKPVRLPSGRISMKTATEIRRLLQEGVIHESENGYYYPKATVEVITAGLAVRPMRWDLVPRGFMHQQHLSLPEALKAKDSRAKDSKGFSSYNARIETVQSLWAFKSAWKDGNRGVLPVEAWRERPNMDGAPANFRGREYEVSTGQVHFLAALYDTWKSRDGDVLDSCTVITGPSDKIPELQAIWHERTPILLDENTAEVWMDPATTPDQAMAILRGAPVPPLTIHEVEPKPRKLKKKSG